VPERGRGRTERPKLRWFRNLIGFSLQWCREKSRSSSLGEWRLWSTALHEQRTPWTSLCARSGELGALGGSSGSV